MSQEELKAAMMGVMDAFTKNPDAAKTVYRSETKLVENLRCEATVRDFAPYTIDEPKDIGGGDAGPSPVELMCMALGTCQEIIIAAFAAVKGIPIDGIKVDVKGYLDFKGLLGIDKNVPSGFTKVQCVTNIQSSASAETLRELVDMAESHCPVYDSLVRPVEVTGELFLNGTKI